MEFLTPGIVAVQSTWHNEITLVGSQASNPEFIVKAREVISKEESCSKGESCAVEGGAQISDDLYFYLVEVDGKVYALCEDCAYDAGLATWVLAGEQENERYVLTF